MVRALSHREKCTLIEEMYEWLIGIAISIGLGFQDAQDVVQEACCRFLRYEVSKAAWLTRTTINLCFDFLSRRKHHLPLDACIELEGKYLEPWEVVHKKNTYRMVYKTILLMEHKYRHVLILRYFVGLSVKEISQRLDLNANTVLTRLHRARRILINFLT